MTPETTTAEIEAEQILRAKQSGRTPVVFVHGLWLLPSSWDRWAAFFEEDDFVALTPGWPDDPVTIEEAHSHLVPPLVGSYGFGRSVLIGTGVAVSGDPGPRTTTTARSSVAAKTIVPYTFLSDVRSEIEHEVVTGL